MERDGRIAWSETPLGPLAWAVADGRLVRVWLGRRVGRRRALEADDPLLEWLRCYLAGAPAAPPSLADPASPFQARLRAALLAIPFGEVVTYGSLARALGSSPRAVGRALAANPLPLVVPCHRVVAARGLGGFSAGLHWKRMLLCFERAARSRPSPGEDRWTF